LGTKADSHFKQYKFSSFTGIYHSFRPQLHVNPVNPVYKIESVKVELINNSLNNYDYLILMFENSVISFKFNFLSLSYKTPECSSIEENAG
jgi:hypothetical protein